MIPFFQPDWRKTQDPARVGLAGIKRVVFAPPNSLINFAFDPELGSKIVLDKTRSAEITAKPVARDSLLATLFSGMNEAYLAGPARSLMTLVHTLEFHFENGSCASLAQIASQPDLPDFLNPLFYVSQRSVDWSLALGRGDAWLSPLRVSQRRKENEELQKTWIIVIEILNRALERRREQQDLEVVINAKHEGATNAFRLDEITLAPTPLLTASVCKEFGASHNVKFQVWQEFVQAKTPGRLTMYAAETLNDIETYFVTNDESLTTAPPTNRELACLPKIENSRWHPTFAWIENGVTDATKTLLQLEQSFGCERVFYANRVVIEGNDFKPELDVREDDGSLEIATSFAVPKLELRYLNLPTFMQNVFAPFYGALDSIFKMDRKDVASAKKEFRANDLLFLRHQGAALFTLFELVNWICAKPLSSGETIAFVADQDSPDYDRQFDRICEYLKQSIPALLGKRGPRFEQFFSPRVQNIYLDLIEKIQAALVNDRSFAFHPEHLIEIKNVYMQVLPILRFVLLHLIDASDGKFLTKIEPPIGERLQTGLARWAEPVSLRTNALGGTFEKTQPIWIDLGRFRKYSVSLLFELAAEGFEVELDGSPLVNEESPFDFRFDVSDAAIEEDNNWFDLHPQVFFDGTRVSMEAVRMHFGQGQNHVDFIEYQGRIYRIDKKQMPTMKALKRFWDKLKRQPKIVADVASASSKVYRFPKSEALELLMLKAQGIAIQVEGRAKKIFDYFENGLGVEKISLPENLKNQLLPHQLEGAQWLHDLYELELGALLADEMGSGKTLQVLAFLQSLHSRAKLGQSLLVVPTSIVYNWLSERSRFAPALPMTMYRSSDKRKIEARLRRSEPIVLVATYGEVTENPDFFQNFGWNVVAFDEAQNLKNILARRSLAARELKAGFKIAMTGTPMENNYLEFYALCDLVVSGCLGQVEDFRREFVTGETRDESIERLRMTTRPLVLRRTKDVLQIKLPEKTVVDVKLAFSDKQKAIYKKMAMTFSRQVDELVEASSERQTQFAMLAALMRLRQICSDPTSVPGVTFRERPTKVVHLATALQEHLENQESVIVFTQFLSTLGRLEVELKSRDLKTFVIHGGVKGRDRAQSISDFTTQTEPGVMLMTLKTGGVGLNLTKASVVYHVEPWWNPAVEAQATDRAHRMGQTKDVKVYNLLIEGSLEERIADLKVKKQDAFDRLFLNPDVNSASLEAETAGDFESGEVEMTAGAALSQADFHFLLGKDLNEGQSADG